MSNPNKSNTSAKVATLTDAVTKLKDHTSELNNALINKINQTGSKDVLGEVGINLAIWDIILDLQYILSMKIDSRNNARADMFIVWESSEDEECVIDVSDSTVFNQIYVLFTSFQADPDKTKDIDMSDHARWNLISWWLENKILPLTLDENHPIGFWSNAHEAKLLSYTLSAKQWKELYVFTKWIYDILSLLPSSQWCWRDNKQTEAKRLKNKEKRLQQFEICMQSNMQSKKT